MTARNSDVYFPASTALVLHEGKLVLVKLQESGKWVLPGGTIEEGEDPMTCILREVPEETGLRVTHCSLLFIEDAQDRRKLILDGAWADNFLRKHPSFDIEKNFLVFGHPDYVYLVEAEGTFKPTDVDEVKEVCSFTLANIPFDQIGRVHHKRYIQRYIAMQ